MRRLTRLLLSYMLLLTISQPSASAQEATTTLSEDCARIMAWMESSSAPPNFIQGGGVLNANVQGQTITADDAGDVWFIPIATVEDLVVNVDASLPLKVRLFKGMELLGERQLDVGAHTLQFAIGVTGHYTLVITRQNILDTSAVGTYDVSVSGGVGGTLAIGETQTGALAPIGKAAWLFYNARSGGDATVNLQIENSTEVLVQLRTQNDLLTEQLLPVGLNVIRLPLAGRSYHTLTIINQEDSAATYTVELVVDPTVNRIIGEITPELQPVKLAGDIPLLTTQTASFTLNSDKGPIEITAHADALLAVANNTTNIRLNFGGAFEIQIPSEASAVNLVNGGLFLSLRNGGQIYVEQFNWRGRLEDPIGDFRTLSLVADRQEVRVDWQNTRRVWVQPQCIGLNLTDERRILAEGRSLVARAPEIAERPFPIIVDNGASYELTLDWRGLRDVILTNNRVQLTFDAAKQVITDQLKLDIAQEVSQDQVFHVIRVNNQPYLSTDWQNITQIQLINDQTLIELEDSRGSLLRPNRGLKNIQTRSGVIRLQWDDGGESLLLPESEDFLQIETPPSPAAYDPDAYPNVLNFRPGPFNNIGLDCYPIQTIFNLNCGNNGEVNPSNGNLAIHITDLHATALRIDLKLTRTYNSLAWERDGPFGRGWTSNYLLDFNIPFDEHLGARLVHPHAPYRVALDLSEAPRGEIRYSTPTGSQHIFRQNPTNGEYRSPTLPGWKIPARENVLTDGWRVIASDGLIYHFDRAGRLQQISHPHGGALTIERMNTPPSAPAYRITAQDGRAIMLQFDDEGHIIQAQLHSAEGDVLASTAYQYSDGYLTQVQYDDGTIATYRYENGQLSAHNDPRAPLATELSYVYSDNRVIRILDNRQNVIRSYDYNSSASLLRVTINDEWGRSIIREYARTRATETNLRLQRLIDVDGIPTEYTYNNESGFINGYSKGGASYRIDLNGIGLPERLQQDIRWLTFTATYQTVIIGEHTVPLLSSYANDGINGEQQLTVVYDADGQINTYTSSDGLVTRISARDAISGLPTEILLEQNGTTSNTLRLTYDARGFLIRRSDDSGLHQFQWDDLGRLIRYTDPQNRAYTITHQPTPQGRCVQLSMPFGGVSETCENAQGQVLSERIYDHQGAILTETLYTYDQLRRLTSIQESAERKTTYDYQPAPDGHWILIETAPDNTQQWFEYDAQDRLVRHVDNYGIETRWQYTPDGITQTQNEKTIRYLLSAAGQLCGVNYGAVEWVIRYDSARSNCNPLYRYPTQALISLADTGSLLQIDYDYTPAGRISQMAMTLRRPAEDNINNTTLENVATTIYRYDGLGRIESIAYPDNSTLTYHYGRFNNGERTVNIIWSGPDGQTRTRNLVYDSLNRLIRAETQEGRTVYRYSDQANGRTRVQITFFTGVNETASAIADYDAAGRLIAWQDEEGRITTYDYDALSRLIRVTKEGRIQAEYTYDAQNRVTSETNTYGRVRRFVYDDKGQIVTERFYDGSVINYGYDLRGNLITITDALGYTTRLNYDAQGELSEWITPTGQSYRFRWIDKLRGQFGVSSPDGESIYAFDMLGRLWQVVDAQGNRHLFTYNGRSQLTSYRPYGVTLMDFSYLPTGELRQISGLDEAGNRWAWTYEYDNLGRLIRRIEPDGRLFNIAYDQLGRLLGITHLLEGFAPFQRTYSYPEAGVMLITDAETQTTLRYDALNRLVNRTISSETDLATETYAYDAINENYTLTDANGVQTIVTYSPTYDIKRDTFLTVKQFVPHPLLEGIENAANELYQTQWAYIYNPRGDLTEIRRSNRFPIPEVETCFAEYRNGERELSECMWLNISEESVTYDAARRPLAWQSAADNITIYTYNAAGHLATLRYPDGNTYRYSYTPLGQLSEIVNPSGQTLKLNYTNGLATEIFLNDTLLERYQYSTRGQLIARSFPIGSATSAIRLTYSPAGYLTNWSIEDNTYTKRANASGRLQSLDLADTGEIANIRFSYDSRGRVIEAVSGNARQDYTFALNGQNIRWIEPDGTTWSYTIYADGYELNAGEQSLQVKLGPFGRLAELSTQGEQMTARFVEVENLIEARLNWGDNYRTSIRFNADGYINRILHERRDDVNFEQLSSIYTNTYFGLPLFIDEVGRDIFLSYSPTYQQIGERWVSTDDSQRDRPLYIMNVVYDALGNRTANTLQLVDGRQESYVYTTDGVLIITRELNYLIAASVIGGLLGLGFFHKRHQKYRALSLTCLVALVVIGASAQTQKVVTQQYLYNTAGHVATIISNTEGEAPTATRFDYDALGRLIAIRSDISESVFTYDAFGRLATWTNPTETYQYYYDGEQLSAIKDDAGIHLLVSPLPNQPLWMTQNPTQWYLYDGQGSLRRTFSGSYDNGSEVRFETDQFGRLSATASSSVGLPIFSTMLYDTAHNIYIRLDGRAYDPLTGRYLQRDPLGPDANGNLYHRGAQRAELPINHPAPLPYLEGLMHYASALQSGPTRLTATDIIAQHLPTLDRSWPVEGLTSFNDMVAQQMNTYLEMPTFLGEQYNLSGLVVGEDGRFVMMEASSPMNPLAQTARETAPTSLASILSLTKVEPTVPSFVANPQRQAYSRGIRRPDAIIGYLPASPLNVGQYPLLVEGITQLPTQSPEELTALIEAHSLPTEPELPPKTMKAWLARWFSYDTLPTWSHLRQLQALPPIPSGRQPSLFPED